MATSPQPGGTSGALGPGTAVRKGTAAMATSVPAALQRRRRLLPRLLRTSAVGGAVLLTTVGLSASGALAAPTEGAPTTAGHEQVLRSHPGWDATGAAVRDGRRHAGAAPTTPKAAPALSPALVTAALVTRTAQALSTLDPSVTPSTAAPDGRAGQLAGQLAGRLVAVGHATRSLGASTAAAVTGSLERTARATAADVAAAALPAALHLDARLTGGALSTLVEEVAPGAQPGQEPRAASAPTAGGPGWRTPGVLGLVGLGTALTALVAFLVGLTTAPSSPRHGTARDTLLPPPGRGLRVRNARRPASDARPLTTRLTGGTGTTRTGTTRTSTTRLAAG